MAGSDADVETIVRKLGEALIKATRTGEDGHYNTAAMRDAAGYTIDLRELFLNKDGLPDYGGRSWPYREAMNEALDYARMGSDERPRVMSTLRYHISNLLRERLTAEQLADYGMQPVTAIERQREDRKIRARMARIASRGDRISSVSEAEIALRGVVNLLRNIERATAEDTALDDLYSSIAAAATERTG